MEAPQRYDALVFFGATGDLGDKDFARAARGPAGGGVARGRSQTASASWSPSAERVR
jgi:hypothetical protein